MVFALTKLANRSDTALSQIICDDHDNMPAFGKQMTDAQIDAVVSYVKQLSKT